MGYLLTLPKTAESPKLQCNLEVSLFHGDMISSFWTMFTHLFSGPAPTATEVKFLESWLTGGFIPAEAKSKFEIPKAIPPQGMITRYKELLRQVRPKMTDLSVRATCYKHCFAASLYSERDFEQLITLLAMIRESFEIDLLLEL